jgi:hypothetical protein
MKLCKIYFVLLCISIAPVCRAQTENTELPVLKGEWKLDSIIQEKGEKKLTAFTPNTAVSPYIYYSCPEKIQFNGQTKNGQLVYASGETNNMSFYVYKSQDSIYLRVSVTDYPSSPEWQFDYFILTASQNRLSLMIEYALKPSDAKSKYKYYYSLIK